MKWKKKTNQEKILQYIEEKKYFHESLLDFIDNIDEYDINYNYIINLIEEQNILKRKNEFEHFLCLLVSISNNHHRCPLFFSKIERILKTISNRIKQTFSNTEIFHIFMSNKIILLFLINEQIITLDNSIIREILNFERHKKPPFCHFFLPEMRKNADGEIKIEVENEIKKVDYNSDYYLKKRMEGENDEYICSLIRHDSIDEFISFVNTKHISISSRIPASIYETNEFLINKSPTMIEYAAFFGSIQIFNYLFLNNVELSKNLWEYAIHSNEAEIIHLFETKEIKPSDETYKECLLESIKCHHNPISIYIKDNLLKIKKDINNQSNENDSEYKDVIDEQIISYGTKYDNYLYLPKEFKQNYVFYYISKYNYSQLVKIFLKMKMDEIEQMKINKINNNFF